MTDISMAQLILAMIAGSMPSAMMLLTVLLYLDRKQSKRMDDMDTSTVSSWF